jgi:chemotaxis protein methyltransferase CheR
VIDDTRPPPRATSSDEYVDFCVGVRRLTGLDLGSYNRAQMERRIRSHAERHDTPVLRDFLRRLRASPEWLESFLDRITINVSELYRDPAQYETLRAKVVPELRRQNTGSIQVWSAGCSYGAEAYTLACILSEEGVARFGVTGSDIDPRMVARARRGWFSSADMRHVPPRVRDAHFAAADGGFLARAALATRLRFRSDDLLAATYAGGWDLVLCRNVVIYFTDAARAGVHRNIAASLRPGGYLMIGPTERVADPRALGLVAVHPFMYRKSS